MENQDNVAIYNRYVVEYMARFMDLDLYKDTFDHLLNTLPATGTVLELGCGPGNVVKYIRSQRPDLQVLGIDLAPAMIDAAREANPGAEFRLLDIRQAGSISGHFDAVIAAFCIPYLPATDVPGLFSQMKRLTTAGKGMVYLSCMEGPRERSGPERTSFTGTSEMYINYYPRKEIESLFEAHGFIVEKLYLKDYPEADGTTTTDLIYIAESAGSANESYLQ
jgi:SAM-dependent methyltransferase